MTTVPVSLHALLTEPFAPTPPVAWRRDRWQEWAERMGDGFAVVDGLGDTLDRAEVAAVVDDELARGRTVAAFVAAAAWVHGDAGDAAYRAATVLAGTRRPTRADDRVVGALHDAAEVARHDGPVAAHRTVLARRLHGLAGPALTAWLHFVSARRDPYGPHAAPVLDAPVRRRLATHAGLAVRDDRTLDYTRYVERLATWGRPFGRTPVQVEAAVRALGDLH
ncbi:hypothetical protein [Cellulomonas fimi]|uniref:Uncharacterized protein n=1 Tax=Cellulomonas fimi (strain ATCC 484 / DSM 20113 / JCM 1341 / CCUG 24087 / LMG 16345 / NBRC 15513 / NCIMB 8980 / NCTC 7547 / NRS-133) TaxID=590998 RepID=F4H3D4_CELFA|nr:hypothetical protein [Cellulomonas fimi]AEE45355.1 hypothetical protein Celf_1220 [Cellulomonas fimi ATCC 484]NNH08165.1 hypothetical protein [Cellulomonas fimi]VEH29083.1 Uncharacterised protein [Cellulomonas fimi]